VPNLVIILADDMGYGDVATFGGATSRIATPSIDRLAAAGMRFLDAHAAGAWCVPSRYGLLTGRYPFRNSQDWSATSVIEADRLTLPGMLRQRGYATAMIGKWHLGFEGGGDYDYEAPLAGGPVARGFDSFFGMPASLDIPPYFFIRDDRAEAPPTEAIAAGSTPGWSDIQGAFWREGMQAPGFRHVDVMPRYLAEALAFLEARALHPEQPFFLYLALSSPHTPWVPTAEFAGRSSVDLYGDFVMQTDATIGAVLGKLDEQGLGGNTLVLFTSDNGPVWYPSDVTRFGHAAAGPFRGMKGDAWEAGHRMPLVVRWPGHVAAGSSSDATICFTDVMATLAELLQIELPSAAAEDSFSFLPSLLGSPAAGPGRAATVVQSIGGVFTIRRGPWKLITALGSGGFSDPASETPEPGGPTGQLYHLATDPAEQQNLFLEHPDEVAALASLLDQYRSQGRTRP
jgi:arylsulfatase A-like enzyme